MIVVHDNYYFTVYIRAFRRGRGGLASQCNHKPLSSMISWLGDSLMTP